VEVPIVSRRSKGAAKNFEVTPIKVEGEQLEPIRKVVRDLKRPDGTTLRVEVPVYPPFRLKNRETRRKTGSGDSS
jgi:hypothetical protein